METGADNYKKYLKGDQESFVELVHEYKDGLILYLNSFVSNVLIAEELAQDAFVRLGVKRPLFLGQSSFKTFLYSIGRKVALDYLRKQKKEINYQLVDDIADEKSLEQAFFKKERDLSIHACLKKIKSEYQQVLWLIYFEQLSNKEVAKIMHKSTHAIETLVYRGRLALKQELEKEGIGYEDL